MNVYATPEKFRATIVGEVEWVAPCYSFDTTIVLKDEQGRFYVASDDGCSCPTPFEDFDSLEACLGPLAAHEVAATVHGIRNDDSSYRSDDDLANADAQIVDVLARVMK